MKRKTPIYIVSLILLLLVVAAVNQYYGNFNGNLNGTVGGTTLNTNIFNIKDFGAFGDGQFVSDISVTSGLTHVSSPFGHWGSTNVGNHIGLCACGNGFGNPAGTWFTTIASIVSPTEVVVSAAPAFGVTNGYYCVYGLHDDSSALQSAINAAMTAGSHNIYAPPGVYLFSTNFVSPNEENAMINVPYIGTGYYQGSPSITINGNLPFRLWGGGPSGYLNPYPQATVFVVMANGNDITSTNCLGSSFISATPYEQGAPTQNGASSFDGIHTTIYPINNVCVHISNLSIVTGYDPHLAVVNFMGATDGSGLDNVQLIGGNAVGDRFVQNPPSGTNSYGYIPPGNFQGTFDRSTYDVISGYFSGVECGCFDGHQITIDLCSNPYDCYLQDGIYEGSHEANISDCPNIIANTRGSGGGYGTVFDFDFASIQGSVTGESGWWTNNNFVIEAINDPAGRINLGGQGRILLPYTNALGSPMPIRWVNPGKGIAISYYDARNALHYVNDVVFDGGNSSTNIITGGSLFYNGLPWLNGVTSLGDVFVGNAGNLSDGSSGDNDAVGGGALAAISTGSGNNDAFGFDALHGLTSGSQNTAFGKFALVRDVSGNNDASFGYGSLAFVSASQNNTAIGFESLQLLGELADPGTYNNNIAIGSSAGINLTNGAGNIYIGSLGVPTENNTTRIGIDNTTTSTIITNGGVFIQYLDIVSNSWSLFKATNGLPNEGLGAKRLIDSNGNATVEMQWQGGTTYRSNYLSTPGGILP